MGIKTQLAKTIAAALLLLASLPAASAWTVASHTDPVATEHPCDEHQLETDPDSIKCFTGSLICEVFTSDCAVEILGCRIGHDEELWYGHYVFYTENCPVTISTTQQAAATYYSSEGSPPFCPYVVPFVVCAAGYAYCEVFTACEEEIAGVCVGYDPNWGFYTSSECYS